MPDRVQLPERLGTVQQAAKIVPCSVKTIRRRIYAGQLTAYRDWRRIIRVDLDQVEELFTVGNDAA